MGERGKGAWLELQRVDKEVGWTEERILDYQIATHFGITKLC